MSTVDFFTKVTTIVVSGMATYIAIKAYQNIDNLSFQIKGIKYELDILKHVIFSENLEDEQMLNQLNKTKEELILSNPDLFKID